MAEPVVNWESNQTILVLNVCLTGFGRECTRGGLSRISPQSFLPANLPENERNSGRVEWHPLNGLFIRHCDAVTPSLIPLPSVLPT